MRYITMSMLLVAMMLGLSAQAKNHLAHEGPEVETYQVDIEGMHAFIQFKVSHLGFSYIIGRFNRLDGSFIVNNRDFSQSSVSLKIDTASIDSNHAERDKHLRGDEFLNVKKFPQAKFVSTRVEPGEEGQAKLIGDLTLHGVTKEIVIAIREVGKGTDPWGGYRRGFEGTTEINPKDFGIGPIWLAPIRFELVLEGIRQ